MTNTSSLIDFDRSESQSCDILGYCELGRVGMPSVATVIKPGHAQGSRIRQGTSTIRIHHPRSNQKLHGTTSALGRVDLWNFGTPLEVPKNLVG